MSDIDKLNMAIMNIFVDEKYIASLRCSIAVAYKIGHRGARYAAVECVLEHFKNAEPRVTEQPDTDVMAAAWAVVQDAIDGRRAEVHPCDRENNDLAVARQLPPLMQGLFRALQTGSANTLNGGEA